LCRLQTCITARRYATLARRMRQDALISDAFMGCFYEMLSQGASRPATWPMRWQRSIAWSSMAEFQYGSIRTTLVATCASRATTSCSHPRPLVRAAEAAAEEMRGWACGRGCGCGGHAGARWGARTPSQPAGVPTGTKRWVRAVRLSPVDPASRLNSMAGTPASARKRPSSSARCGTLMEPSSLRGRLRVRQAPALCSDAGAPPSRGAALHSRMR